MKWSRFRDEFFKILFVELRLSYPNCAEVVLLSALRSDIQSQSAVTVKRAGIVVTRRPLSGNQRRF